MTNPASLTVTDIVSAYRDRSLSPVEVAKATLEKAEQFASLNAFVRPLETSRILAEANESEARWRTGAPKGRLDGVPISVKDAILAKGWPTLAGSTLVDPNQKWAEDAPAVARLREENAIILGKTTSPEFGWKGVTDSPLTGITRNPWNSEMTPGGSSGGSAAAVAAGIGLAAVGTDAAGSVRVPGSFCGLVALKATRGRIPASPPSPLGTMAHVGPICRSAADTSLMLAVLSQPDPRDWNACLPDPSLYEWQKLELPDRKLRVAYSATLGFARVTPQVRKAFDNAVREFANVGAEMENVEKPFDSPEPFARTLFEAGVAHAIRRFGEEQRRRMDPGLVAMAKRGEAIDRRAYMEAVEAGMMFGRTMRLFHQKYDLLLTPTVATEPFEAGRLSPDGYDQSDWLSWSPFGYPFNVSGQPALTIPCGFTDVGLPVGLQVVGNAYADRLVLSAAHAYEKVRSTRITFPPPAPTKRSTN